MLDRKWIDAAMRQAAAHKEGLVLSYIQQTGAHPGSLVLCQENTATGVKWSVQERMTPTIQERVEDALSDLLSMFDSERVVLVKHHRIVKAQELLEELRSGAWSE